MLMKLFSAPKKNSRAAAKNALLLDLFATPGLGSLVARRWVDGAGQLALAIAGFAIFVLWFVREMVQYYGQITGDVEVQPIGRIGVTGVFLFALSWFWSLVTSLSLLQEASKAKVESAKSLVASQKIVEKTV